MPTVVFCFLSIDCMFKSSVAVCIDKTFKNISYEVAYFISWESIVLFRVIQGRKVFINAQVHHTLPCLSLLFVHLLFLTLLRSLLILIKLLSHLFGMLPRDCVVIFDGVCVGGLLKLYNVCLDVYYLVV